VADKVDVVIEPTKVVAPTIVTATELGKADTVEVVKSSDSPSSVPHAMSSGKPKVGFNNSDAVLDMGTNKVGLVEAPKDIVSLANKTTPIHGATFPDDDDDSLTISAAPAGSLAGLIEEL
jgi:hypothetical protein